MTREFWMPLKMISPGLIEQSPNASLVRIQWLAKHFDEIKPELLTGTLSGFFKLRAGGENLIVIHRIGHRREVYKL